MVNPYKAPFKDRPPRRKPYDVTDEKIIYTGHHLKKKKGVQAKDL